MKPISRIAFIGNSLPRRCGIATFTTTLEQSVAKSAPGLETCIVAMTDHDQAYEYPANVGFEIHDNKLEDYRKAADFLNAGQFEVVSLQHEFGIFGGEAGGHIMTLLSHLTMPVVTTLHTVLEDPSLTQRRILDQMVTLSVRVIVMAEKARELLRTVYNVPAEKIEVIPHGIPNFAFTEPEPAKEKLGFSGRAVILTFGLLSPGKGIEVVIDAMPAILKSRPDAIYIVLGNTHPTLVHHQGEEYRDTLLARVRTLGLEDHIVFVDQFLDQTALLDFISMCDVYVTPYLNEAQMTSGTLAYSFGLGKAVVSTPYWHAKELLSDGSGILVPFGDADAIGREISGLLVDDDRRHAIREWAYARSRSMTWERTAERYMSVFDTARRGFRLRVITPLNQPQRFHEIHALPEMRIDHFLAMCDDTGLFQHAILDIPDRRHGYCVDDNARALLLACALSIPGEQPLPDAITARFAAFVQHAWNPDTRRFRNFMSFDRRWVEDSGSEDSQGRTLWALGECARSMANASLRHWAAVLFAEAIPAAESFASPRAWAFSLLGLNAICFAPDTNRAFERIRRILADRLMTILSYVERPDWVWFEEELAYDNARLPHALISSGVSMRVPAYIAAGLKSLRWLTSRQISPAGFFRPIGTGSFGVKFKVPDPFDQQPLEATATISACLSAWGADGEAAWRDNATRAFAWFHGDNDLSVPLVDLETGSCRDGLHFDRPNENKGGESVVSYLLSLGEMRQMARLDECLSPHTQQRFRSH